MTFYFVGCEAEPMSAVHFGPGGIWARLRETSEDGLDGPSRWEVYLDDQPLTWIDSGGSSAIDIVH